METAAVTNEKTTIKVGLHVEKWAYSEFMPDYKGKVKGDARDGFWWGIDVEIDKEMFELFKDSNLNVESLPFHFDMTKATYMDEDGLFDIWFDDHSDESVGKEFPRVSFAESYERCVEEIKEYTIGFIERELENYLDYYKEKVEYADEDEDVELERELCARLEAFFKKAA